MAPALYVPLVFRFDEVDEPHLAAAAFAAISFLRFAGSPFARAFPPIEANSRTVIGFTVFSFFFAIAIIIQPF
jgi:hypothetical protein